MPRSSARRRATYQDVLDAPEWVVAEVVDGELYTTPRPAPRHTYAESALMTMLGGRFGFGLAGPSGWTVLVEPELHLELAAAPPAAPEPAIVVPDLAAWHRDRMLEFSQEAYFRVVPDWICEILSPGTATFDREKKLPIYARAGVTHAWLVDPAERSVQVLEREGSAFRTLGVERGSATARMVPFDALEIGLSVLWGD